MIITLDGPTASGKSTVARLLAHRLGFYYINTGLLYRAVAYILMHQKKYTYDMLVHPVYEDLSEIMHPGALRYLYYQHPTIMFCNEDITAHLKDAAIDKGASIVSSVLCVRELLLGFQRHIAHYNNVVAEGRDTGTIVFPSADYKFYITADTVVRAERWLADQAKQGRIFTHDEAQSLINERDTRDSQRTVAPLVIAQEAIVIDTSHKAIEDVVQAIVNLVKS